MFMHPDIRTRMLKFGFNDELLVSFCAQTIASEFANVGKILGSPDLSKKCLHNRSPFK